MPLYYQKKKKKRKEKIVPVFSLLFASFFFLSSFFFFLLSFFFFLFFKGHLIPGNDYPVVNSPSLNQFLLLCVLPVLLVTRPARQKSPINYFAFLLGGAAQKLSRGDAGTIYMQVLMPLLR